MAKTQWIAKIDFYFVCELCGLTILEGNPKRCPHQHGKGNWYNKDRDGIIQNRDEIYSKIGLTEKKEKVILKPILKTQEQIIAEQCPKGG